jgi:hypothetical protein
VYTVFCRAWDENDNEYTAENIEYIYVYDRAMGLRFGRTDFCFKLAVTQAQGSGISPIAGTWVWPNSAASVVNFIDNDNTTVTLVLDSANMTLYRIGIPELWVDREGDSDESEILCEEMLPEIESSVGPHENVRHIETHISMRPHDEREYRGKSGYDSEGFKDGNELAVEIYSNGEQVVPETILSSVNKNGDFAFLKDVEGKRFQIKLKHSTSAFRVTRVGVHMQCIDHRTAPQLNALPEMGWQREFSLPDIWLTRKTMGINRADGSTWAGDYTTTTGPDGKPSSATVAASGFSGTAKYTTGTATISAWIYGNSEIFRGETPGHAGYGVVIEVVSNVLTIYSGVQATAYTLATNAGWRHLVIVVSTAGASLSIYEAGVLLTTVAAPAGLLYSCGGACIVGLGTTFDVRRHPRVIFSAAVKNYYDSILLGGGGFLP